MQQDSERFEALFSEGWREPGDDCERLSIYILFFLGVPMGIACALYGAYAIFHGLETHGRNSALDGEILGPVAIVVGLGMAASGSIFLWKESHHWDLKKLNAEKIVSGGFLFGFALMLLGFEVQRGVYAGHGHGLGAYMATGGFFGLGAADLLAFLFIGLVCAYWQKVPFSRRTMKSVYVVGRYAVDDCLNRIPDHPNPTEEGCTPYVVLRTSDGKLMTLRANESSYDLADPESIGDAVQFHHHLEKFSPHRSTR